MGVVGSGARPGRRRCVNRASAVGRLSRDRPHDPAFLNGERHQAFTSNSSKTW